MAIRADRWMERSHRYSFAPAPRTSHDTIPGYRLCARMVPLPLKKVLAGGRQCSVRRLSSRLSLGTGAHRDSTRLCACIPKPPAMPWVEYRSHHPDVTSLDLYLVRCSFLTHDQTDRRVSRTRTWRSAQRGSAPSRGMTIEMRKPRVVTEPRRPTEHGFQRTPPTLCSPPNCISPHRRAHSPG